MKYTITSNSVMSLREQHTTYAPRIAVHDGLMQIGEKGSGDELWICPADGDQCRRGDQWLHVLWVDAIPVDGWVAVIHMGKVYCTLVDHTRPMVKGELLALHQVLASHKSILEERGGLPPLDPNHPDGKARADPSVVRVRINLANPKQPDHEDLTCRWQEFHYQILLDEVKQNNERRGIKMSEGQVEAIAVKLMQKLHTSDRFQNNGAGLTDNRQCYGNVHVYKKSFPKQFGVMCSKTVVFCDPQPVDIQGHPHIRFKVLNSKKAPPNPRTFNHATRPTYIWTPYNETRIPTSDGKTYDPSGTRRIMEPFSYKINGVLKVPYEISAPSCFLIAEDGDAWVPVEWIRLL